MLVNSYIKLNNNQHNNKNNTNFKGFYTSKNFYKLEKQLYNNPNITKTDVTTIKNSIEAFEALNRAINKGKISANQISDQMMKKYNIPTEFHGDAFVAASAALTSNIMKKLGLVQPNSVSKAFIGDGIAGTCGIFTRDVRLSSSINWAKDAQDIAINDKLSNFSSSGHFLSTPVHEYMHSVHMNNLTDIQKKYKVQPLFPQHDIRLRGGQNLPAGKIKQTISQNVSNYGSTKPVEAFAEFTSKIICDNLNNDKQLLPKDYTIFKIFGQPVDYIIRDFWSGNFSKYV